VEECVKKQEKFKPVTVLLYGLSIGCLFWGMTIILIEYFDRSVISIVGWQIFSCALFLYYFAVLVGKTQDETVFCSSRRPRRRGYAMNDKNSKMVQIAIERKVLNNVI
jgi:hypothetical protein